MTQVEREGEDGGVDTMSGRPDADVAAAGGADAAAGAHKGGAASALKV